MKYKVVVFFFLPKVAISLFACPEHLAFIFFLPLSEFLSLLSLLIPHTPRNYT